MGYVEDIWCAPETALPLSEYIRRLPGLSELDFWGVNRGYEMDPPSRYWLGTERQMFAETMNVAQDLMEGYMGVRLVPTWTDAPEEKQWIANPHTLDWARFIAGGQEATSIYQAAAPITYAGDYGTVTVAHGGVGQASEVRAWYDDTQYPIEWSDITFGVTNIVLQFPRQRLVTPTAMATRDNDNRGLAWELASNFLETLTVGRVYNDPSVNAKLISKACNCICGATCQRCSQDACIVPSVPRVGTINVYPASYSVANGWARSACLVNVPDTLQCYYRSGLAMIPANLRDALIRLTHTLMPTMTCPVSREPQHSFWLRDVEIREIGAREILNCPWGNKSGAWWAWNVVSNHAENYGKSGGYL